MQKRLEYIDAAKGVLIIFVVVGHMYLALDKAGMTGNGFVQGLHALLYDGIIPFYMPAFFIITGFCSNFKKEFWSFLWSSIISLKAPCFFFIGVLGALAVRPLFGFSPFDVHYWFIRMFETGVWFLHALFLSRLCYWVLCNKCGKKSRHALVGLLYIGGSAGIVLQMTPAFWIFHAMVLTLFLHIGQELKPYGFTRRLATGSILIYAVGIALLLLTGHEVPFIVEKSLCNLWWHPIPIAILSTCGTIALISLLKYANGGVKL